MTSSGPRILIMAAGTGGHVFPAMSIAARLQATGADVHWLATRSGLENELLRNSEFTMHRISVSGLRGSGIKRKLLAPIMLIKALSQSMTVIRQLRPDCILGMGGFVCGPAGLAGRLAGVPLLIHEQNAVAGITNKILSHFASRVFEGFPNTFPHAAKVRFVGNPLRSDIVSLYEQGKVEAERYRPLHILVLGGSQGAAAINKVIPEVLVNWGGNHPEVRHQTGARNFPETQKVYQSLGLADDDRCSVTPFIEDMAAAYQWADIVICRSGASTVSELAAAGLPAILVPYPYHKDRQQVLNAEWLSDAGAAVLVEQSDCSAKTILPLLHDLDLHRDKLTDMRARALSLAIVDAAEKIAGECLEVANG